jgi:cell wall assembly regulator SMI1
MPVSGEVRLLDDAILRELEERWRQVGAFIIRALRPGICDSEMDRVTAAVGLRVPNEARRWWSWHDGAEPQVSGIAAELGPGRAFLSLRASVRERGRLQQLLGVASGGSGDPDWRDSWLPIDAHKRPIVFDCGVGTNDPVPVRSFFMEDADAGAKGVASIGELVLVWIEAMDCGAWSYNRAAERWEYNWQLLRPEIARLHLT